ncbi:hypothetical protein BGZ46_003526 [Entomortierella lignicola]|nr:hypothetical protein BGZ46_003526 [Entomortierella lignicola]
MAATLMDAYMTHVGDVLDMLVQDRTIDPISQSFSSSSSTPLLLPTFVNADASPLIHKVDVALQQVVQKMFLMEHELSRHRRECLATTKGHYYFTQPGGGLSSSSAIAPHILTPPVDPLSPPMSTPLRWSEGTSSWEFITHEFSTPDPLLTQPQPSSSIHSLSNAVTLSADNHNYNNGLALSQTSPTTSSSTLSLNDSSLGSELSTEATASTISCTAGLPIPTTSTTLAGFLSAPSAPSSPDSFCSANSTFPLDDSDAVSTSHLNMGDSPVNTTQLPILNESPCAACIHNCALVASAVVKGDLGVRISCQREACNNSALTLSINQMVSKLSNFTTEVIQVAAQGVEGKLGVQAKMKDEHGIWKEFVSHLNTMTVSHSEQVRDIASVCTAVAHGDLSQKITVSVKGETLVLKNTINTMGKL